MNTKPVTRTTPLINVDLRIMGREYTFACPPDEHEAMVASADLLNERMTAIRKRSKALGAERIAVMAALNLARQLLEAQGSEQVTPPNPAVISRLRHLRQDIDSTLTPD